MRHKLPEEKKKKSFSLTLENDIDFVNKRNKSLRFGNFETKLFNNFYIQRKQIN